MDVVTGHDAEGFLKLLTDHVSIILPEVPMSLSWTLIHSSGQELDALSTVLENVLVFGMLYYTAWSIPPVSFINFVYFWVVTC